MPMEPFANQTFRCPRCGSSKGPSCDCWRKDRENNDENIFPKLPQKPLFPFDWND